MELLKTFVNKFINHHLSHFCITTKEEVGWGRGTYDFQTESPFDVYFGTNVYLRVSSKH